MQPLPLYSRIYSIIFVFLLILNTVFFVAATQSTAKTTTPAVTFLDHIPVASASAGKIIPVTVKIHDKSGVVKVRLYFKTMSSAWYVFLEMTTENNSTFTTTLPPAKNNTKGIDYIILIENGNGNTVKSRTQRILILNDYFPLPNSFNSLEVLTELTPAPPEISDFAVPLHVTSTTKHRLLNAQPYIYPPITLPGPTGRNSGKTWSGFTGTVLSIGTGSVGIRYRSSSGQ